MKITAEEKNFILRHRAEASGINRAHPSYKSGPISEEELREIYDAEVERFFKSRYGARMQASVYKIAKEAGLNPAPFRARSSGVYTIFMEQPNCWPILEEELARYLIEITPIQIKSRKGMNVATLFKHQNDRFYSGALEYNLTNVSVYHSLEMIK